MKEWSSQFTETDGGRIKETDAMGREKFWEEIENDRKPTE